MSITMTLTQMVTNMIDSLNEIILLCKKQQVHLPYLTLTVDEYRDYCNEARSCQWFYHVGDTKSYRGVKLKVVRS